jgi:hypothetical protein
MLTLFLTLRSVDKMYGSTLSTQDLIEYNKQS